MTYPHVMDRGSEDYRCWPAKALIEGLVHTILVIFSMSNEIENLLR
jgi:hypothetical protein